MAKKTKKRAGKKKTAARTSSRSARKSTAKKKPAAKSKSVTRKKPARSPQATIDKLDREIIKLANQRADSTTRLYEGRRSGVFDPEADDKLWQQLYELNNGSLPDSVIRGIFRQIISAARKNVRTLRAAYLGPQYSFTHLAAIERFGESADLVPVSTIAAVFEEVNRGNCAYGLVPIENSTDGRVVDTLDMFQRLPLKICGEVQLAVHHNLMARCDRSQISEVYSKPQALSQCRDWLERNMPQARLFPVTSTSTAAELARTKHGVAAVASRQAAVEYELQIIAENIEDNPRNITRFAVIGDESTRRTGKDRTALLMQIPHKPGSLADALMIFKKSKVNLTWIESFPLRGVKEGYLFFLDFEGHVKDAGISRALQELEKKATVLNVLGSYPRSEPRD